MLLNADNTVLFTEGAKKNHKHIKCFCKYYEWKFTINPEKSKFIIFGERASTNHNVTINNKIIEGEYTFKLVFFFSKTIFFSKLNVISSNSRGKQCSVFFLQKPRKRKRIEI